jgi:hypothetical protein
MALGMRILVTGYEQVVVDRKNVIAAHALVSDVKAIVETETLYEYASKVPNALTLRGRGPVYVIPFGPKGELVAVRHSMRGGWMAKFMKDTFLPPTRAFRELISTIRLRLLGIPTPEVLAIVTYPVNVLLRRVDVMTRFIEGGVDLAAIFSDTRNDAQRRPILDAVAALLGKMTAAGVQHQDLNLKNILITAEEGGYTAHLLDVDRVHFHVPNDPLVARANIDRLTQSLRKWRTLPQVRTNAFPEDDIRYLTLAAAASAPQAAPTPAM